MANTPDKPRSPPLKTAFLGLLLAAAWLLWSGMFKPLLLVLGFFSCLLVLYLARRMHLLEQDVPVERAASALEMIADGI